MHWKQLEKVVYVEIPHTICPHNTVINFKWTFRGLSATVHKCVCIYIICTHDICGEPGSSVIVASGYGLDNWAIEVRFPADAKEFFCSLCVQTSFGAHPASCTMGTGGPCPRLMSSKGVTLATHPHLVPRLRMRRSYTSSPPKCLRDM
jgi:hypothetical protein